MILVNPYNFFGEGILFLNPVPKLNLELDFWAQDNFNSVKKAIGLY